MRVVPPTTGGIEAAVKALREGRIVAYPTETVYGLGVDPRSEAALERLFQAKGRESRKAVLVIVDDVAQLQGIVAPISSMAQRFIDRYWPGPLSLLLPAAPGLPNGLVGPGGKVCVRCPSCKIARSICRAFGGAVTSTSANPAGGLPARCLADVSIPGVALGVDGGVLAASPPSTVFDPETGQIVREGVIPGEELICLL